MRIAFLCSSSSWGGLEMNLARLALRMQKRGHETTVFAQEDTPFSLEIRRNGLAVESLLIKHLYTDIRAARKLAASLKAKDIQVLLFSVAKDNYLAGWAKIFFYQALQLIYIQQMELGIPKKGIIQTWLYRKLAAWVSPLQLLAQQVREKTFMPQNRIRVIPLGIDVSQFEDVPAMKERARAILHLPPDAFIAGIVGRIDPAKGQEYLIKALKLLHERGMYVHVLFVGEETRGDTRNYLQHLQQLTQTLQLEEWTHFRPFMKQTEIAFAALDVFVMASQGETYGMVTIEAMASGLAVIGTNSGGTPELLNHGELGILVKPNDEYELANALEKLLTHEALRIQMGNKARQNAANQFSYQFQCEQIEHLLTQVIRFS